MTTFPKFSDREPLTNSSASLNITFIYASTFVILPLYSISFFNLTVTFLLIDFCKVFNGFLIVLVVSISLLSVYWHHQMYLLHKKEMMVRVQNEQIDSINRQLKMERSELQSGVIIYKKSQDILLMHSPSQIKELSL